MRRKQNEAKIDKAFSLYNEGCRSLKEIAELSSLPASSLSAAFAKAGLKFATMSRVNNQYKV